MFLRGVRDVEREIDVWESVGWEKWEEEQKNLHLLSSKDQTLLYWWDAFFLLHFLLDLRDLFVELSAFFLEFAV